MEREAVARIGVRHCRCHHIGRANHGEDRLALARSTVSGSESTIPVKTVAHMKGAVGCF
jgi:hypothetical protein